MIKVLIRDKHEKCSVTVLLSYTMSIVYVLAIHPLLDGARVHLLRRIKGPFIPYWMALWEDLLPSLCLNY